MADIPKIHSVASKDKNRALSAMFMAFTADPLARWFAPEADHYVPGGLGLMEAFGGKAFEVGQPALLPVMRGCAFGCRRVLKLMNKN